ncbi:NAD-dependent epimerase/dehydratase family protein [Pseudohalocynthiibacter aestuariivivens]|uniref:NAD-dependent epimerase/dehydratase family protein n=1 Tax=Pseudohalocynthiibacter aestuariivivens TaxID=1591409 RepID=A0ABV5JJN7_9RHOB|nr:MULTISPECIES: NAD-dependent epimerase/dehydratase family protein [Pseudohalocynthiibacter]MBS9718204.1 NAD-dependent epimerase/dehydratase family protein [Pseudohalocynthiibacter aestuariivivens]MCK0103852.1 NAD-dependent epimerase/dehydratase family protein [Pseudohalocynthiibacter sp. F2068]
MKVLVLGATGMIGTAVTKELLRAGHKVTGLCQSDRSARQLERIGATPLPGDLQNPGAWAGVVPVTDGIIQAAATFKDDMGAVDRCVLTSVAQAAETAGTRPRFIYTGGCWLYGETGDEIATEESPFNPLPAFSWMVKNGARLAASSVFSTAIIHPAMVYHASGGAFAQFMSNARRNEPIEIWRDAGIRWPLVHRDDLARAYRLLLERPDLTGHFNASAQAGVKVGDIATWFAGASGIVVKSAEMAVADHGRLADGPMLDQQMSATKLQNICNWIPQHVDFRASGISRP